LAASRWELEEIDAFVELHIEQGPVLDRARVPVGIVTAVTGRQAVDLCVRGVANHAGTTPMELRHDALAAAAEIVLAVEALPGPGSARVATTGHVVVGPNVRNVVPGEVQLGVEIRDTDAAVLDAARQALLDRLDDIAARRGVAIDATWGQRVPPQPCGQLVVDAVRTAVGELALTSIDLPSGAGHDAQVIGRVVPTGMIFVPSIEGISHSPDERTDPEHLVVGAEVLLHTLLELDRRLS
jgi:hydantoinase/carbamoylase family amidase